MIQDPSQGFVRLIKAVLGPTAAAMRWLFRDSFEAKYGMKWVDGPSFGSLLVEGSTGRNYPGSHISTDTTLTFNAASGDFTVTRMTGECGV
jgi:hypothetical protein